MTSSLSACAPRATCARARLVIAICLTRFLFESTRLRASSRAPSRCAPALSCLALAPGYTVRRGRQRRVSRPTSARVTALHRWRVPWGVSAMPSTAAREAASSRLQRVPRWAHRKTTPQRRKRRRTSHRQLRGSAKGGPRDLHPRHCIPHRRIPRGASATPPPAGPAALTHRWRVPPRRASRCSRTRTALGAPCCEV